jgi:hypothetical protein
MSRLFIISILAVLALLAVAALELYSHTLSGIRAGGPVPLQSLAPRPGVAPVTPPAARNAPASRVPSAHATASPSPATLPATNSQSGPPKIVSVALNSSVVTGGQIVTGTVQTSANVTSVQASIGGYSSGLQKVSSGYFALSYRVPNLPFFLHRTYTIVVTAQNARGESVSSSLPVTVR